MFSRRYHRNNIVSNSRRRTIYARFHRRNRSRRNRSRIQVHSVQQSQSQSQQQQQQQPQSEPRPVPNNRYQEPDVSDNNQCHHQCQNFDITTDEITRCQNLRVEYSIRGNDDGVERMTERITELRRRYRQQNTNHCTNCTR